MLSALELENFKAFGTRTRIEFAPITLIFGENSAGKSSILQALNLLKQTRQSRESGFLLMPRTDGGFTDLGSYQELVHDHDTKNPLTIKFEFEHNQSEFPYGRFADSIESTSKVGFELSFERKVKNKEIGLKHIALFTDQESEPVIKLEPHTLSKDEAARVGQYPGLWNSRRTVAGRDFPVAKCTFANPHHAYWTKIHSKHRQRAPEIQKAIVQFARELDGVEMPMNADEQRQLRLELNELEVFYKSDFGVVEFAARMSKAQIGALVGLDGFVPVQLVGDRQSLSILPHMGFIFRHPRLRLLFQLGPITELVRTGQHLDMMLESLFPMGPYRRPPERWYLFTGSSPRDVGYSGELLPDLLFRNPSLVKTTNQWLDRLAIGYHLKKISSLGNKASDFYELRLEDQRRLDKKVAVALSDVGYGISQILPFVVQCLAAQNQIISIEQPEVHVHPKLQADLGDLLIEAARVPRQHRLIIETHSEHLLLRLLRRIRETNEGTLPDGHPGLHPDQVSVLYVSRGENGSHVQRLRIDATGEFIDRWPKGFFEERAKELF